MIFNTQTKDKEGRVYLLVWNECARFFFDVYTSYFVFIWYMAMFYLLVWHFGTSLFSWWNTNRKFLNTRFKKRRVKLIAFCLKEELKFKKKILLINVIVIFLKLYL